MKAIILAGGLGKRLRPLTDTVPKSLLTVAAKPILEWQILWLKGLGVDHVVLCLGYLREKVMAHVGQGAGLGIAVDYALESQPLGTGGALRNALPHLPASESFFVLNGDILSDLDVKDLWKERQGANTLGALALVPLPSPYGIVGTDDRGRVTSFLEKPTLADYWINGGVYCFAPGIAPFLPEKGSLEHDVFPLLAQRGQLVASKYPGCFWRSIDSPKDIEEATQHLGKGDTAL